MTIYRCPTAICQIEEVVVGSIKIPMDLWGLIARIPEAIL